MSEPLAETIPRLHQEGSERHEAFAWHDLEALLRDGSGTTWLSVRTTDAVHTRPIFAAWTGSTFVFATKARAVKTRHLEADGHVTLAIDLGSVHLIVDGAARRLVATADLERASAALDDVYDWPTTVVGDELDAPYAAPTSGGPPMQAWEIVPSKAVAQATDDQAEPTRFTF